MMCSTWTVFGKLWGDWKCDQTLSWVFDIRSPSKLKLERKRRNKSIKIYANLIRSHIQTHSRSWLPLLKLDELLTSLRSFCHTSLFTYALLYAEHEKAGFFVKKKLGYLLVLINFLVENIMNVYNTYNKGKI